ncbi:MAG: nucleotide triphosphate diphosphatase NUDT15 [Thermodesulfobacteriota bacterium]
MKKPDNRPFAGVGVMVLNRNKVLLGKRKNSHGSMTWSFPGGHLEFGESLFECAKREVLEETGIKIKNLSKGPYTNDIFTKEKLHYITVYIISEYDSGEVTLKEPEKCLEWVWFDLDDLPKNLFLPLENLLKEYSSLEKIISLQKINPV